MQVQGRFKRPPEGSVYLGCEISNCMQLGMVTRGAANLLLAFMQRRVRQLHYSFGDRANAQLPHVVMPLWTSADDVIVTPLGEPPPELGRALEETAAHRAARKSGGAHVYRTDSVYTFAFHTMYIDLPSWKAIGMSRLEVNLHNFWHESALRFVAYAARSAPGKPHLQSENDYLVCVQARHLKGGGS